ncbi:LacI family DNA-binding transcriptional regulator [Microbacterium sp. CFBP9034]|uniref:LacI family DNA-binding transcriptional regulator n=1 Tax=Microbacterium sp. CFBP9034 TaxID=3096540 RepID=UPI002A6A0E48|nr:LacI family DNA-binding transcriptional regulator [Microbacterium sp. CFBP9034]MDY0908828.1 LacI family DNA-binding transcriptional regulator [Microbacterium sp. CFBP9034]
MDQPSGSSHGRPTLYDVAAVAAVSHTTVARVVHGEPGMTEATRRRVRRALAQLGYEPNASARALAERRPAVGDSAGAIAARTPPDDGSPVAAAIALGHLAGLGHRSVVRARGGTGPTGTLRPAKIDASGPLVTEIPCDELTSDGGFYLGGDAALLKGATAVLAPNPSFALGLIRGLEARGIRVPEHVSVLSLEDSSDAAHYAPSLTAVGGAGAEAAPRLCIRDSTAPASPPEITGPEENSGPSSHRGSRVGG